MIQCFFTGATDIYDMHYITEAKALVISDTEDVRNDTEDESTLQINHIPDYNIETHLTSWNGSNSIEIAVSQLTENMRANAAITFEM